MRTIKSRHNPLIKTFRTAARTGHATRAHLLLDGAHLVREAHDAGVPIDAVLVSAAVMQETEHDVSRLARRLAAAGVEVHAASEPVLRAASPVRAPSGIVALATHRPRAVNQILADAGAGLVVSAVGVQDPGNIGAIVRAADAGGARAVVVTEGSADPFGWRALRGAMGSSFRLPIGLVEGIDALVDLARSRGTPIVAAVPRGGTGLYDADLTGSRLVLVGQEGAGLGTDIGKAADVRVSVPMRRSVESLNVAVAAALIIYEARRQSLRRRRGGSLANRPRRSARRTTP